MNRLDKVLEQNERLEPGRKAIFSILNELDTYFYYYESHSLDYVPNNMWPLLWWHGVLIANLDKFAALDEAGIAKVARFTSNLVEAIYLDVISGETHKGSSFRRTNERDLRHSYDRHKSGDKLPQVLAGRSTHQPQYLTESEYLAIVTGYGMKPLSVQDLLAAIKQLSQETYPYNRDYQRFFTEPVDTLEEGYRLALEIGSLVESMVDERILEIGVGPIIESFNEFRDSQESSIVVPIELIVNIETLRSWVFENMGANALLLRGLEYVESMQGQRVHPKRVMASLSTIISSLQGAVSSVGHIFIPCRLSNGLVYTTHVELGSGRISTTNAIVPNNVDGLKLEKTGIPTAEILAESIHRDMLVPDYDINRLRDRHVALCGELKMYGQVPNRNDFSVYESPDGISLKDFLFDFYMQTKLWMNGHSEVWRTQILDRRMQHFFAPKSSIQEILADKRDHYRQLLARDGITPDVSLTTSGLAANTQALLTALKIVGKNAAVYENPGWYFENSLNLPKHEIEFVVDDIDDANIILLSVDPNAPQVSRFYESYRHLNQVYIWQFFRQALMSPDQEFVVIFDKTSGLLEDYEMELCDLPKNLTLIETASITKYQRGRQTQFYGITALFSNKPDKPEMVSVEEFGGNIYGESILLYPKLEMQELQLQRKHEKEQMRIIAEELERAQSNANIPEEKRWKVEVYERYCFILPPTVITGSDLIKSIYNEYLATFWNKFDENGKYKPTLKKPFTVDKGDSYGTARIRATLFSINYNFRAINTMRISAGMQVSLIETLEFARFFARRLAEEMTRS